MKKIQTGSRYEALMGYSRAVVAGQQIHVSGCSGLPAEGDPGDAATQFARAAEKLGRVLAEAGATLADVVRTRVYLTDPDDWDALAVAHGRAFGEIRPAATMVQVVRLIHPRMRVELEADAALPG